MFCQRPAGYLVLPILTCLGVLAQDATAVPVQGQYVDDPLQCDNPSNLLLGHELGDAAVFPINEGLAISVQPTTQTTCGGNDGAPNDWHVRIINISGTAWQDLHLVVDTGFTIGNADGDIQDITLPGFAPAFRIDGTVTPGINNPLQTESGITNEILEPGEIWDFLLPNFTGGFPFFTSPGGFAASSLPNPGSNVSILANAIPEPNSLLLLVGGSTLALFKRRRADGMNPSLKRHGFPISCGN